MTCSFLGGLLAAVWGGGVFLELRPSSMPRSGAEGWCDAQPAFFSPVAAGEGGQGGGEGIKGPKQLPSVATLC
jgi:hypothetical protein